MIAADEFAGVTIDTSVFDQYGCNLRFRTLLALKQFRDTGISVVLSTITMSEVKAHLRESFEEAATKLKQALNQYDRTWQLNLDKAKVGADLGVDEDPAIKAATMIDEFMGATGATLLPIPQGVAIQQVVDLYFGGQPPFAAKGDKKSEFPDAIALLSLEAWAGANGAVLAVSRDGDWQRYAEGSVNLVCVDDLPAALALFNDADRVIGARIATDLREGRSPQLKACVESALERFVEEFDIEANGADYYEAEPEGATVTQWSVSQGAVNVVSADADTLTVVVRIEAEVEFHAGFRFSHWDSIDREYIRLPGSTASTIDKVALEVAITIYKDDLDDPAPHEVSIESSGLTADFGYVEPDWG
ncbi:MAG: PIN domain-containing protein [Phenylobacterium sp.]|uniref:PIN domain-containing protein n=1 Tax=Phenylobacterium sp. TaxID=1871053 RepID=UPI00273722B0|nr:PIN domain-containing protein [Phenylobacterium sp.]MDP3115972.1 PIN domain-containing protein [Phenylobacterium sp.]